MIVRSIQRLLRDTNSLLVVILGLGIALRLWRLGERPLWLDEARLYWIAQGDPVSIVVNNYLNNSAPPLFAFLLAIILLFNQSEFALRLISFLASSFAIPAIYFLAKRFVTRSSALFCAFFVAIAPSQVLYAQQAREYALTFLLAILTLLSFDRYLETRTTRNLVLLLLIYWIDVWTQYGLSLLIGGLGVISLLEVAYTRKMRHLVEYVVLYLSTLVMQVLVFLISLQYQIRPGGFGAGETSAYLAAGYWMDGSLYSLARLVVMNSLDLFHFAILVPSLTILLSATGILSLVRYSKGRRALALFLVPLLVTLICAVLRLYPYGGIRQDIFLVPMIYLFVSEGLEYVILFDRQRILLALILILCVLHPVVQTMRYHGSPPLEDIRPLVQELRENYQAGEMIYVYYGVEPAFRYYYRENVEAWIVGVESRSNPQAYFEQLDATLKSPNLWLVFSHCHDQECERIVEYVSRGYRVKKRIVTADTALYYATRDFAR